MKQFFLVAVPFVVCSLFEPFDSLDKWKTSNALKANGEASFTGTWSVRTTRVYATEYDTNALVLQDEAKHSAISRTLPQPISNRPLVIQYEVQTEDGLSCGGAYLKLLTAQFEPNSFSDASDYVVMFGPDRCGITNKVHLIVKVKNKNTGNYVEHHLKDPPTAEFGKLISLYSVVIDANDNYVISVNGVEKKKGSLLTDMEPSLEPLKTIDDPNDSKPSDWVEEERILDPNTEKPLDWDDNQPSEIIDVEAVKPADWLDDESESIPDSSAKKPVDWDDGEDGEWIRPTIPNPKCDKVSGCGEWKQPMKLNPDYKGIWQPPLIENPAYQGEWKPKQIPNPDYYKVEKVEIDEIVAVGFELWSMQANILFDNLIVGNDVALAKEKETEFEKKINAQRALKEVKEEADRSSRETKFEWSRVMESFLRLYEIVFQEGDLAKAFQQEPLASGTISSILVLLVSLVSVWLLRGKKANVSEEKKND